MSKIVVFLVLAVAFCNLAFAETSLKPYSPFDEPKPRIPKEIMEDKRLDVKVNVFVKSKNFRDLFAEITRQTGVKLTADRDIAAERAIIYFHARSLRDVMTKLSGLFGYYWLPKGKEGSYSYELFEDSRHAVHRDQLRRTGKDAYEELIVTLANACTDDAKNEAMKRLLQEDPGTYDCIAGSYGKPLASIYAKLGRDFVHRVLNEGPINFSFPDLPPEIQSYILDWNKAQEARSATSQEDSRVQPLTPEDVSTAAIKFERVSYGMWRMPRLGLFISKGNRGYVVTWPLGLEETDLWTLTGHEPPPEKLTGDKLLDEPAITLTAKRKDLRFGMEGNLMLHIGDAVQGIAEQSGKDIIADYYFQETFLKSQNKEPLAKLVKELCEKLDYSCQVEGSTLRFRFNKWYLQPLLEEPPARLLEAWWQKITSLGRLDFQDLITIVGLSGKQGSWPGLRFIPGVDLALKSPASWNIWDSFGKDLEAKAQTGEGLPVLQLSRDQFDQLAAWVKLMPWVGPEQDLAAATIRTSKPQVTGVVTGDSSTPSTGQAFMLEWPGRTYQFRPQIKPLSEQERNEAIAQRKADVEADKVEVVEQ